jgi:hypothetical protein
VPAKARPDFAALLPPPQQCVGSLSNVNEYMSLRICADMLYDELGAAAAIAFCQSPYLTDPDSPVSTALVYAFVCALKQKQVVTSVDCNQTTNTISNVMAARKPCAGLLPEMVQGTDIVQYIAKIREVFDRCKIQEEFG